MSILLTKGAGFASEYYSAAFPILDANWTGSVSFYTEFPGTPVFTKAMTLGVNVMLFDLTIAEIMALDDGVYTLIATITNTPLAETITSLEYATIVSVPAGSQNKCKIFGTIIKVDGSAAGFAVSSPINNGNDLWTLANVWKGVPVVISHPVTDVDTGLVVGTETVTVMTNAAGYFEAYVLQAHEVTLTCRSFSQVITIDTTGLSEYDIAGSF